MHTASDLWQGTDFPLSRCQSLGTRMLQRIYETAAYGEVSLAGCYWRDTTPDEPRWDQFNGADDVDVAIIGGGYTGLSAALDLARTGMKVAVFDGHRPGWGASGRNGGFCCIGGTQLSGSQILRRYGAHDLASLRQAERASIEFVQSRLTENNIDADIQSTQGELRLAHNGPVFKKMAKQATDFAQTYRTDVTVYSKAELREQGMTVRGIHGGVRAGLGFALNPRKYVLGLARAAIAQGAKVYADSAVLGITTENGMHVLRLSHGDVRARRVLIATNGYSADNLPDWMRARYLPVQSSIIVTRPLTAAEITQQGWTTDVMAYDSRNLLHYFRMLPDGRMMFGMRGAVKWSEGTHISHRKATIRHFRRMFPAWRKVEVPWFWSGLICMTRNLVPFAGPIGDNIYAAFGWHGNGVAMGSWTGSQMAQMILGKPTETPEFFSNTPKRFELGRFRRNILPLAIGGYRIADVF